MGQPAYRDPVTEIDHLEAILLEQRRTNMLLERLIGGGLPPRPRGDTAAPVRGTGTASKDVADDADLDSEWGNPAIRKDPPRWQGDSFAGMPMSEASPEYLESLAGFLDWCAAKADEKNELANNGKLRSIYLRKDAARARGWALRNGNRPTRTVIKGDKLKEEPIPGYESDDDVPFLGATISTWPSLEKSSPPNSRAPACAVAENSPQARRSTT